MGQTIAGEYRASPAAITEGNKRNLGLNSAGSLRTTPQPHTSGGLSALRVVTGTTGVIKATPGQLFMLTAHNLNAAVRYLHIYNKATAPTLSTDTPVLTISLSATSARDINLSEHGLAFATGISWAATTDNIAIPATAGTTAEMLFTALYK